MKILVTGAAGFVGRHLIRRLLERGDEIHAVDALLEGSGGIDPAHRWPLFEPRDYGQFHFNHEDCRDYFRRVKEDDFDCCFHLAAVIGGRATIEAHPIAVGDDLAIDAGFWQWAVGAQPGKIVFFSSSAAYPIEYQQEEGYRLLREDMIDFTGNLGMPDLTYGWAKLTGEYLARLAHERHGLKSVVYRPFSGYGEDQDDSYPFPSICRRAMRSVGEPKLTVWGTGLQMRDFIHVDDCIDGILQTMDLIDDAQAVNLSTGQYTSFREFAALVADVCGYAPEVVGQTEMPSGVFARAGDTTRQQQLGFIAGTDLRTGIARAIEYYSERE